MLFVYLLPISKHNIEVKITNRTWLNTMTTLKNQNYFSNCLFDLLKVLRATVSFTSSRDKKSYAEEVQTPFRLTWMNM